MYPLKKFIIILLTISCVTSYKVTLAKNKSNRKNILKKRPNYKQPNEDVLLATHHKVEILPRNGKPPTICPKGWGRRAGYGYECVRED